MRLRRRPAVAIALTTLVLFVLATHASARPPRKPDSGGAARARHRATRGPAYRDACPAAPSGHARCLARLVVEPARAGRAARGPDAAPSAADGYGPADLRSAYHLASATAGAGQTVAVVAVLSRLLAVRDGGRRHHAGPDLRRARLERVGVA